MANDRDERPLSDADVLILIVDADPGTREALAILFLLEGFQISLAMDAGSFLAALRKRHPDVAVINLQIAGADGMRLLRQVKSTRAATPVFMLEDSPRVDAAVAAMKAGATDVITKPIDAKRFIRAVRQALRANFAETGPSAVARAFEVTGLSQLTPRERDVLQLIASGQSNKEAGRQLGISPRTIEVHRARLMKKLGARNTADLMRIVLAG